MEAAKRRRVGEPDDFDLGGIRAVAQAATARVAAILGGSASGGTQGSKGNRVQSFLTKLGLEQYTSAFVARGLAPQHVRKMSDAELYEQLRMPQEHIWLLKRALGETCTAEAQQHRDAVASLVAPETLQQLPPTVHVLELMTMQLQAQEQIQASVFTGDSVMAKALATAAAAARNDGPASLGPKPAGDDPKEHAVYALGQVAEESAQLAMSTAAFFSNQSVADPGQIHTLSEAALQAAQRARWAANTMDVHEPDVTTKSWVDKIKGVAKQAADTAENAAHQCVALSGGRLPEDDQQPDLEQRANGVPCKFFLLGKCWKGTGCEFAHEVPDLTPCPLIKKREQECIYFARGQCTRGPACPFAHGAEELEEISRLAILKKDRSLLSRFRR